MCRGIQRHRDQSNKGSFRLNIAQRITHVHTQIHTQVCFYTQCPPKEELIQTPISHDIPLSSSEQCPLNFRGTSF
jgi:hypothetical protein